MKRIGEILDIVIEQNGVRSRGRFPFSKILESEHEKTWALTWSVGNMFGSEKVDQEGQVLSGEVHDDPGHAHDAVFGKISDDGPNYRNVSWTPYVPWIDHGYWFFE